MYCPYDAPAMDIERLPLTIEPLKFAKAGRQTKGAVDLSEMPCLSETLRSTDSKAEVSMSFDCDEDGRAVIDMRIEAVLPLTCQRCLDVYQYEVDTQQLLTPVKSPEEAEKLPTHLEPFLLEGEFIEPNSLIEECLLLEVPIVPMHDSADCQGAPPVPTTNDEADIKPAENPFAVLADLKESLESEKD